MPPHIQNALENWSPAVPLALTLLLAAIVYLRGWLYLRSRSVNFIPSWRAASFLIGVFLIWVALGSPLAALDEELLTVHMIQHLLLMTLAPPLILLGAPVMPFLHGLPRRFMHSVLFPLLRWAPAQWLGRFLSQPAVCWLAAVILTTRLLSARRSRENEMLESDLPATLPTRRNSHPIEVA